MKGTRGIKKLYGGAGRRYGGGERICLNHMMVSSASVALSLSQRPSFALHTLIFEFSLHSKKIPFTTHFHTL